MPDRHPPDPTWDAELNQLIQHGRDREAAELASHRLAPPNRGALMDPRAQLDEILPLLNALVAPLDEAQLDAKTPCATFTVRGVVEHMIGGATMFAAAFRGTTPPDSAGNADVVAAFPVAMAELQQAVHSPGALDRIIAAPIGEVPGDAFARFVALDGLIHGWDISTATGQPYAPSAQVVADVDSFARQALSEDMRDGDTWAAATDPPVDASQLVRLVAFTGRHV
jgi:uncharacterized protein (TIGR03086 family)